MLVNFINHKVYSCRQMREKLQGLSPSKNVTYIIDNDLYLYNPNKRYFEKLNHKKLTLSQIKEILIKGNENNRAITICYTGDNRDVLVKELLDEL